MSAGTVRVIAWPVLRALLPALLAVGPIWALLHERRELLSEVSQSQDRAQREQSLQVRHLTYLTGRVDQIEAVLCDADDATTDASGLLSTLSREVQRVRTSLAPAVDDDARWIHARWRQLGERLQALAPDAKPVP